MAENDISISEMTTGTFSSGALFPAIQPNQQNTYSNVKLSGADIGDGIGRLEFPLRLETENKSIFGAINEIAGNNSFVNYLPTDTASGAIAHFTDGAEAIPVKSLTAEITPIQAGTGTPSPSNPRAISGRTEVNVTRTGVNLFNINSLSATGITVTDGVATGTASAFNSAFGASKGVAGYKFNPNKSYTLSLKAYTDGNSSTTGNGIAFAFYYTDGTNSLKTIPNNATSYTSFDFTSLSSKTISYIVITYASVSGNIWHIKEIQLEENSTATTYAPYTAEVTTIDLGTTVYGATINPLEGTGNINQVLFSDINSKGVFANIIGETVSTFYIDAINDRKQDLFLNSNVFERASLDTVNPYRCDVSTSTGAYRRIYFSLLSSDASTGDQAKQWLINHSATFLYNLATPVPITFEPIEKINTLLGENNIFADSGNVEVVYRADIKKYIDKKISEAATSGTRGAAVLSKSAPAAIENKEEDQEGEE